MFLRHSSTRTSLVQISRFGNRGRCRLVERSRPFSETATDSTSVTAGATAITPHGPGDACITAGATAITRHGAGDACITLNVGGKEFFTLRSTVQANALLANRVAQAEANQEFTQNGGIFIDRDPEHFGFILKHLRNKVELLQLHERKSTSSSTLTPSSTALASLSFPKKHSSQLAQFDPMNPASLKRFTKTQLKLPQNNDTLRELFVEATFFQIPELQETLCERNWTTTIMALIGNKSNNPFDMLSKLMTQLRVTLLALGSGGTIFVTMQQDFEGFLNKIGLSRRKVNHDPTTTTDGAGIPELKTG
jgi:hypothetical protein